MHGSLGNIRSSNVSCKVVPSTETCYVGSASTKPLCIYIYMVQGLDYITAVYSVTTINKIKLTSIQYVHVNVYTTPKEALWVPCSVRRAVLRYIYIA